MISRRALLAGASLLSIVRLNPVEAWTHGAGVFINHGWNTLPLGAGGLVTGVSIANDNSIVCRTDVGNIYRWSGKTTDYNDPTKSWQPLLNFASLGSSANPSNNNIGGWEHVLAPGTSSTHVAVFCDMAGTGTTDHIWYSTNSGVTWNQSNISFASGSAGSNGSTRRCYYKIAVDPANANVAYCGMPVSSGNSAGAYTTLNQAGGSSLGTWASVKTSGTTAIGAVSNTISAGLAFDSSLVPPTTTVGGQTVTKRIIIPIGGVGIYESTDGGVTFAEVAVSTFGTANFFVTNGGFTAAGVYYCIVVHATIGGIWRYASGTWTNITSGTYSAGSFAIGTILIIDPRNLPASKTYLSVSGPNGLGAGFTSTNADTGSPPTWTGLTSQERPNLLAASYDIPYLNFIFGQQASPFFTDASSAIVDSNGNCFWGGNQSFWYFGTSNVDPTPNGVPHYANTTFPATFTVNCWSMGRGQEATVSQDALVPPGGTYPILAPQDLGAPMRGTFTTYPQNLGVHFAEYDCASIEYAASDSSFVVACTTDQGASNITSYLYSTNYGADGSWNAIAGSPDSLWNGGGTSVAGGQVAAVDHDKWLAVPAGFAGSYVPAFTTTATSTASWSSTNLPSASWMMVSWNFASHTSKPFAVGYGADQGVAWACKVVTGSTTGTLYRSPAGSFGTFTSIGTFTISASAVAVYCLSVPGFPNELWITAAYTGGSNTNLWHVTNANTASATITAITNLPANVALPLSFTLGAPSTGGGYPTLYLHGWASSGATQYLYQGIYSGSGTTPTWSLFGTSGQSNGINPDLPASCQLCGVQAIRGDWNVYQRLYVSSNQSGFAYYNP
jgi:hypothetical protein